MLDRLNYPEGLPNPGTRCWFNAMVQCLRHALLECPIPSKNKDDRLLEAYAKLIRELDTRKPVSSALFNAVIAGKPQFRTGQHDPAEFLHFLTEESPFLRNQTLLLSHQVLFCAHPRCGHKKKTTILDYSILQLHLEPNKDTTLQQLLDGFETPVTLPEYVFSAILLFHLTYMTLYNAGPNANSVARLE